MEDRPSYNPIWIEKIRQTFGGAPNPEVSPDLWAGIEQKLPSERKEKKFIWVWIGLTALILASGAWYYWPKDESYRGSSMEEMELTLESSDPILTEAIKDSETKLYNTKHQPDQKKKSQGITPIYQPESNGHRFSIQKALLTQSIPDDDNSKDANQKGTEQNLNSKRNGKTNLTPSIIPSIPTLSLQAFSSKTPELLESLNTFESKESTVQLDRNVKRSRWNLFAGAMVVGNKIIPVRNDEFLIRSVVRNGSILTRQWGIELGIAVTNSLSERWYLRSSIGWRYQQQDIALQINRKVENEFELVSVNPGQFEYSPIYEADELLVSQRLQGIMIGSGLEYLLKKSTQAEHYLFVGTDILWEWNSQTAYPNLNVQYSLMNHSLRLAIRPFVHIPLSNQRFDGLQLRSSRVGIQLAF